MLQLPSATKDAKAISLCIAALQTMDIQLSLLIQSMLASFPTAQHVISFYVSLFEYGASSENHVGLILSVSASFGRIKEWARLDSKYQNSLIPYMTTECMVKLFDVVASCNYVQLCKNYTFDVDKMKPMSVMQKTWTSLSHFIFYLCQKHPEAVVYDLTKLLWNTIISNKNVQVMQLAAQLLYFVFSASAPSLQEHLVKTCYQHMHTISMSLYGTFPNCDCSQMPTAIMIQSQYSAMSALHYFLNLVPKSYHGHPTVPLGPLSLESILSFGQQPYALPRIQLVLQFVEKVYKQAFKQNAVQWHLLPPFCGLLFVMLKQVEDNDNLPQVTSALCEPFVKILEHFEQNVKLTGSILLGLDWYKLYTVKTLLQVTARIIIHNRGATQNTKLLQALLRMMKKWYKQLPCLRLAIIDFLKVTSQQHASFSTDLAELFVMMLEPAKSSMEEGYAWMCMHAAMDCLYHFSQQSVIEMPSISSVLSEKAQAALCHFIGSEPFAGTEPIDVSYFDVAIGSVSLKRQREQQFDEELLRESKRLRTIPCTIKANADNASTTNNAWHKQVEDAKALLSHVEKYAPLEHGRLGKVRQLMADMDDILQDK